MNEKKYMANNKFMAIRFIIYGALGCLMEIFWTGVSSFLRKDFKLIATTSIWMFLIYGMAILLEPICELLIDRPVLLRGGIYVLCIFCVEYLTGGILKQVNICPWDYSGCKYSVNGLIRLDYAPAWFAAGMIFEQTYRLLKLIT